MTTSSQSEVPDILSKKSVKDKFLTKQLLEHLSIVTVLLQVFDYDPVFFQLTVDPVDQDLNTHHNTVNPFYSYLTADLMTNHQIMISTFSRSLNLRFSRDVGSNMILSVFSSDKHNERQINVNRGL